MGKAIRIAEKVIPDAELLKGGTFKPLPPDHWCEGCGWAKRMEDRFVCPFVQGSCVRVPGTLEKPDIDLLHKRVQYDRIYTTAHKEVFDELAEE